MELPHIGKNCNVSSCNQLDFLPFSCERCGGIFCSRHKSRDDHTCVQDEGKPVEFLGKKSYPCSFEGCKRKELAQILCHHCDGSFCLNHRLQEDHSCPSLPEKKTDVSTTAQHVKQILAHKEIKSKRKLTNPKAIQMAAKVNLMKIKGRAQGHPGIPQNERVYFKVILPLESGKATMDLFFSKMWSIGRVIDFIAEQGSIGNYNNLSTEKKLRLFNSDSGCVLSPSSSVNEIMLDTSSLLLDGSSLILERVTEDVVVLDGLDKYGR